MAATNSYQLNASYLNSKINNYRAYEHTTITKVEGGYEFVVVRTDKFKNTGGACYCFIATDSIREAKVRAKRICRDYEKKMLTAGVKTRNRIVGLNEQD